MPLQHAMLDVLRADTRVYDTHGVLHDHDRYQQRALGGVSASDNIHCFGVGAKSCPTKEETSLSS
jgi:hypothetical protein